MHFSIPDTEEAKDNKGSTYTVFNIHINGVFHCAVRYKQLHNFHEQLKKEFGANDLPLFPPKKLLSLTDIQLEERRLMLERYIQIVSQEPRIANSNSFNGFFLSAQQETQRADPEDVSLDVFLMNGNKISVNIQSTDQTDDVLEAIASQIGLQDDYVYYFGLYLIKKDDDGDNSIVRKLQDFESPYISLKAVKDSAHKIVLRKSYWDPTFDDDLITDRIAMNLLYVQAVNDIERKWVITTKEQHKQLEALRQKGSKKEYLKLARTLKYYGYIMFKPCVTDYPQEDRPVKLGAGNKELNFRITVAENEVKEGIFKVTRMRCWRITTTMPDPDASGKKQKPKLEIAFEYLMAKDTLKWITLTTDQAILISMCLQGMVDELLLKKQGKKIKKPQDRDRKSRVNFLKKDGTSKPDMTNGTPDEDASTSTAQKAKESVKKISEKLTSTMNILNTPGASNVAENEAFYNDDIGDDDL